MLGVCGGGAGPRGSREVTAARDLEPVHAALAPVIGGSAELFRKAGTRGWEVYRDAACALAGTSPGALAGAVARLLAISDTIARETLLPLVEGAPDDWDSLADMRTAAARILWGRRDFLASLAEARTYEARARAGLPGPAAAGLRPGLAALDPEGWARLVRAEAARLYGDPGEWWVPAP